MPYVETVGIAITYLLSLDWKELQQSAYEELSNCFSPPPQTGQFSLVTYLNYCDWYSVVDIIHLYIYIKTCNIYDHEPHDQETTNVQCTCLTYLILKLMHRVTVYC